MMGESGIDTTVQGDTSVPMVFTGATPLEAKYWFGPQVMVVSDRGSGPNFIIVESNL